jgi:hypothetical protein
MAITRSFAVGFSLLFVACNQSPVASREGRVIGTIDAGGTLDRVIEAPSTAAVGQSFSIAVSTFGNSCVSAAGADVAVEGLVATVTPYDVVASGTCMDYLKPYPRTLQIRFAQAGAATIRVNGRSFYQAGTVSTERSLAINQ